MSSHFTCNQLSGRKFVQNFSTYTRVYGTASVYYHHIFKKLVS